MHDHRPESMARAAHEMLVASLAALAAEGVYWLARHAEEALRRRIRRRLEAKH